MAHKSCSMFALFLVLNITLSSVCLVLGARDIPHDSKNVDKAHLPSLASNDIPHESKNVDVKHPDNFFEHDRSFLIPGLGRYIYPRPGDAVNPVTYNPVTGRNDGPGFVLPGSGGIGPIGTGTGNIPGGDDTFLPSPVGVPSGNP